MHCIAIQLNSENPELKLQLSQPKVKGENFKETKPNAVQKSEFTLGLLSSCYVVIDPFISAV